MRGFTAQEKEIMEIIAHLDDEQAIIALPAILNNMRASFLRDYYLKKDDALVKKIDKLPLKYLIDITQKFANEMRFFVDAYEQFISQQMILISKGEVTSQEVRRQISGISFKGLPMNLMDQQLMDTFFYYAHKVITPTDKLFEFVDDQRRLKQKEKIKRASHVTQSRLSLSISIVSLVITAFFLGFIFIKLV